MTDISHTEHVARAALLGLRYCRRTGVYATHVWWDMSALARLEDIRAKRALWADTLEPITFREAFRGEREAD